LAVLIGAALEVAVEVGGDLLEPGRSGLSGAPFAKADGSPPVVLGGPVSRNTEFLAQLSVPR
jgi:hypothetical protein